MLSRGVARHLALVAGVLLCFFVYMGYRLGGRSEQPAVDPAAQPVEIAGLAADPSQLMTVQDGPAAPPAPLVAPIATPSGPEAARPGSEAFTAAVSGLQAEEESALPPAAPIGSLEESIPTPVAPVGSLEESGGGEAIAGLIPAPAFADAPTAPVAAPPAPVPTPAEDAPLRPDSEPPAVGSLRPRPDAPAAATPTPSSPRPNRPAAAPAWTDDADDAPLMPPPPAAARNADPYGGDPGLEDGPAPSESLRIYVIRPGDTLSRIATRELGSIAMADNIFLLNRDVIPDRDHLVVGQKIRLPVLDSRAGGDGSSGTDFGFGGASMGTGYEERASAPGGHTRMHRVRPGETLSSIAQYYYGSSAGWRFLYEANAATLANPNQLAVGMELAVPPYE